MHGGRADQVRAVAKMRLIAMVEPVLGAFEEILEAWRGTRCPTCNRPTGDVAPVVQVGRIVLDRAGFHPTLAIEQGPPPSDPYADLSEDQIIERLEAVLVRAKAGRDYRRGLNQPAVLIGDGFEMPEDGPPSQQDGAPEEARSIPPGEPPIEDPNA
jgi:hypothetical protein